MRYITYIVVPSKKKFPKKNIFPKDTKKKLPQKNNSENLQKKIYKISKKNQKNSKKISKHNSKKKSKKFEKFYHQIVTICVFWEIFENCQLKTLLNSKILKIVTVF